MFNLILYTFALGKHLQHTRRVIWKKHFISLLSVKKNRGEQRHNMVNADILRRMTS